MGEGQSLTNLRKPWEERIGNLWPVIIGVLAAILYVADTRYMRDEAAYSPADAAAHYEPSAKYIAEMRPRVEDLWRESLATREMRRRADEAQVEALDVLKEIARDQRASHPRPGL